MTPINFYKKEKPLTSLVGMGGGATGLQFGGASKSTYIDDVFSTYLYKGTGDESGATGQTITNGVDLSGEGGMTWIKGLTYDPRHAVVDTVRGAGKMLATNETSVSTAADLTGLASFTSDGFTLGNESGGYQRCNMQNQKYASWSFRKTKGFFDVVTYTGNSVSGDTNTQSIAHDLGSVPGCIIVKPTSQSGAWKVYHRSKGNRYNAILDTTEAGDDNRDTWNNTTPTATHFSVGDDGGWGVNANGVDYVAYLFAGGASTAATAKSVDFDGTNDYLSIPDDPAFDVETNFTAECWFNVDHLSGSYDGLFGQWSGTGTNGYILEYVGTELRFYIDGVGGHKVVGTEVTAPRGEWHHVAISKEGSITRIFLNGEQTVADFDMGTLTASSAFHIGAHIAGAGGWFNGKISNVRVVKGTAVYTTAFRPPTEPLTNITNTVLLCCNDSSQTGSTVTPATITNNGATASTMNPFDDPEGFKFGEDGDKGIITCGAYIGNSSGANGPTIDLGWEPQWILLKRTTGGTGNWHLYDSMRGMVDGGNDCVIHPDMVNQDNCVQDWMKVTPTGFKIDKSDSVVNEGGDVYIYVAIRRPDGYVGKPADAGTDVYNTVNGDTDGVAPAFTNIGFPVDLALFKRATDNSHNWGTSPRLTQKYYLSCNQDRAETSNAAQMFDYMSAWNSGTDTSGGYVSWAWKRGKSFDVVAYRGTGVQRQLSHNLGKVPEMVWIKVRDETWPWAVAHKGLNGGVNPWNYWLHLNENYTESSSGSMFIGPSGGAAPTETHMSLSSNYHVNAAVNYPATGPRDYMMYLFASVDGISKVGSYTGTGVIGQAESTGFTPRVIIIKRVDSTSNWNIWDSLRGWSNGLYLNETDQNQNIPWVSTTGTGFTLPTDNVNVNADGGKYIYYAHA